jgi:hypothetical protein
MLSASRQSPSSQGLLLHPLRRHQGRYQPTARATLGALRSQGLALSLISLMELSEGALTSRDPTAAEVSLQEVASEAKGA